MKKKVILLLSFIIFAVTLYCDETGGTSKQQKIRKLMYMTGTKETAEAIMNEMIGMYIRMFPDIPSETWDGLRKDIKVDELVEKTIPIYDKYFSEQEIDDMITFYETPTGKKLAVSTPMMAAENMQVGQEWGLELAGKIINRITESKK